MSSRLIRWGLALAFLAFAGTAKADTVSVNGSYAFASNGYGIPPYGGTLNGQSESFYCVDFTHDITGGMSWNVNITSLAGSNFSATLLDNQTTYEEMAWLVTNMMGSGSQTQEAEDQFAIWSLTGGPNPFGKDAALVAEALAAVESGFTGQGFEILTPTGATGQEFLVYVPEPSVLPLLCIGLLALAFFFRKRRFALLPQC
jgi:PEP-CTERM motif